ncbi:MAG: APC family permease [Clostridia bacterium]|nr:APC family permease [Clostridia bacterium]
MPERPRPAPAALGGGDLLRRVLTLRTVVSTSAGLTLATTTFVAAAQMASYVAGDSAWIAVLVAGVLALCAAAGFAEMNGMFPSAAAIRVYLHRGFGERLALVVSFLYIGVVVAVLGAESFVLSQAIAYVVPSVPPLVWNVALIALMAAVNIRGVKVAGAFQDVLTYGLLASLVAISLVAFASPGFRPTSLLAPGPAGGLLQSVALGVFLFIGFEWVTPLSEEVTQARLVPLGMLIAVGLLAVTYAVFVVALTATVGKEALAATPVPQMLLATKVLGGAGAVWMLVLSLAASATTFNAGFGAGSRFLYAAGREAAVPRWFARIHMRYFTPQNAIVFLFGFTLVSTVLVGLTGRYTLLVDMGAALESIVYVLVSLAVIRLRRKEPDLARPWRAPFVPWLPAFTAVVFAVLAVGALADDPWAPVVLAAAALAVTGYVVWVVPRLRARAERERLALRAGRSAAGRP